MLATHRLPIGAMEADRVTRQNVCQSGQCASTHEVTPQRDLVPGDEHVLDDLLQLAGPGGADTLAVVNGGLGAGVDVQRSEAGVHVAEGQGGSDCVSTAISF